MIDRAFLSQLKSVIYRNPKQQIQRLGRWGVEAYFNIEKWKHEMEKAVDGLPRVEGDSDDDGTVGVWFLTGQRFWYQTAFCAWTLARQSGRELVVNLVDDGTLGGNHERSLRRLFPEGVTIRQDDVRQRVEALLPVERFPTLRQRWSDYVNIRKLTDIHLDSTGWKLVLDSDMLFFRRPDALLDWYETKIGRGGGSDDEGRSPDPPRLPGPVVMTDCVESYGYSRALMEELVGAPVPSRLNVGICGLKSEDLDWEELERWSSTLLLREGGSYYLEQALVAMLVARMGPTVLAANEYITFPTREQSLHGTGVLQHYVADSKPWYFGSAWKKALQAG